MKFRIYGHVHIIFLSPFSFNLFQFICVSFLHSAHFWTQKFTLLLLFDAVSNPCLLDDDSDALPWRVGFAWQRSYDFLMWGCGRFGGEHSSSSSYWSSKGMVVCTRSLAFVSLGNKNLGIIVHFYFCRQILTLWRLLSAQQLMWCRQWDHLFALCFLGWVYKYIVLFLFFLMIIILVLIEWWWLFFIIFTGTFNNPDPAPFSSSIKFLICYLNVFVP